MRLPLLVPTPDASALLPGERRRIQLDQPRMQTAVRLAMRGGGEVAFLAWDAAQLRTYGGSDTLEPDRLLPVATRCRVIASDDETAVLRGIERVTTDRITSEGCCDHDDPIRDGTEALCEAITPPDDADPSALRALLARLDLAPRLRAPTTAAWLDRLAVWMALPHWVQGEILLAETLAGRIERLADHARELAAAGASFQPGALEAAYAAEEEHHADLVRCWEARARAVAIPNEPGHGRRRQAARLRVRAVKARIALRLAACNEPPRLEVLRRSHDLADAEVDALLAAALGNHVRFAEPLRQAARLLPPGELPLAAWIEGLAG